MIQVIGNCLLTLQYLIKAVPLYNGNKLLSVPVANGSNMKEIYENMRFCFEKIEISEHTRIIAGI